MNLDQVNSTKKIVNIAFYRFMELTDLPELQSTLKQWCQQLGIKGTILLSTEGLNGNLAGLEPQIREFQRFFEALPIGKGITYKESYSDAIPFQKIFIKLKKEIIPAGDSGIAPAVFTGARITPHELKQWLDEGREFEFLDTRNAFEVEFGTFKNAKHLSLKNFRQFAEKLQLLPEETKQRPMVMFCTGGIRCEKASVIAINQGYHDVYQLDGGILKYFEECGGSHYQGECFVFDERVSLDSELKAHSDKTEPDK